ncbi:hypothetical protein D4764_18G0003790 [Takifugu flavidus]|uniref:CCHC-type domain-containing protein n=1 Tax=Takifugu flavidus TaxID=433684 RepID=A0A5C6NQQ8_9TELE|nr:hypothetical protein D4764_18G0003790 [Takifugu flavidus]
MAANAKLNELSRRHGVKVGAGSVLSVEEVALAVGQEIGHGSVKSAARMNRAVVLFVEQVEQANSDEFLERELSRHGKLVSPIRKLMSGCRSPLLKHVASHRRQVHMILNNGAEDFNYRFVVRVDDFDYVLFATSSALKCFNCGEEGHLARACPSRAVPDAVAAEPAAPAGLESEASAVQCGGGPRCSGRRGDGVEGGGKTE